MTSPSSRRAGVVQGPQHAATGPEPSSGVGPAPFHLGEPEPSLRSYLELGALSARWDWYPTGEPAGKVVWCEIEASSSAQRGAGEGREPPFVRKNRPAEMGAAGQRGRRASRRLAVTLGQRRGHPVFRVRR